MWFCYIEHKEKTEYRHHMVIQVDSEDKARAEAQYQFERNFKLDVNEYEFDLYEIKDTYFIFDQCLLVDIERM